MAQWSSGVIFVIGGRGRLGIAIASSYDSSEVINLERSNYQNWWRAGSQELVSKFFEPWEGTSSTIFVTAGILDPHQPKEEHLNVNFSLAKNIIDGATKVGLKVVTFGTVMEGLISRQNPYIYSKAMLGNYVNNLDKKTELALHIRIHTLYGSGEPSPFMFLGQIYKSLAYSNDFEMSPGNQLREYHHIDDEVLAIRRFVKLNLNGVVELSHGKPISLKSIATHIYKSFDSEGLLKVGALPGTEDENYGVVFQRHELIQDIEFREPLQAITTYIGECLDERETA